MKPDTDSSHLAAPSSSRTSGDAAPNAPSAVVARLAIDTRTALNELRAAHPEPGDYWHEMFTGVALVIAVSAFHVTFLGRRKAVGPDHWTWDTAHISVKSRSEFETWLRYSTRPGTWAWVIPDWRHWKEFADSASGSPARPGRDQMSKEKME